MNPGRAVPSPHRAVSGARSFLMNRTPAPQTTADADGACGLHVQRHATAANDRSRLVFRTSDRCTYARYRNRILPRNQIYHVSGSLQSRTPPGKAFFLSKMLISRTCTSLLYKFHPAGGGRNAGIGPDASGISISRQPVPAKMKPNRADSPRFSPSSANHRKDEVAFPRPAWYIRLKQAEGDRQ